MSRKFRKPTGISFAMIAAVGALGVAALLSQAGAQAEGDALRVATYQPQEAFQMYHRTAAFQQEMQQLQADAEQMEPEEVAQLQERAQQMQQELIGQFEEDVEDAVSGIAEENGVKVVATEVVYSADRVEVADVTEEVVEEINDGAEEQNRENALPPLPQQQQQQRQQ